MVFIVSILIIETMLVVCLFFAVSRIYARVATLGLGPPQVPGPDSSNGASRVGVTVAVPDLPPRTRTALESMDVTSVVAISPGCSSCDEVLAALASSASRRTTLIVSAYEGSFDPRLRTIVDEEFARSLVSAGARFPIHLVVENDRVVEISPARQDTLSPGGSK